MWKQPHSHVKVDNGKWLICHHSDEDWRVFWRNDSGTVTSPLRFAGKSYKEVTKFINRKVS